MVVNTRNGRNEKRWKKEETRKKTGKDCGIGAYEELCGQGYILQVCFALHEQDDVWDTTPWA